MNPRAIWRAREATRALWQVADGWLHPPCGPLRQLIGAVAALRDFHFAVAQARLSEIADCLDSSGLHGEPLRALGQVLESRPLDEHVERFASHPESAEFDGYLERVLAELSKRQIRQP